MRAPPPSAAVQCRVNGGGLCEHSGQGQWLAIAERQPPALPMTIATPSADSTRAIEKALGVHKRWISAAGRNDELTRIPTPWSIPSPFLTQRSASASQRSTVKLLQISGYGGRHRLMLMTTGRRGVVGLHPTRQTPAGSRDGH